MVSARQQQTSDTFGFKWALRDTFEGPAARARMREWLVERYGALETDPWLDEHGPGAVLVDAGCGAALSALELFGARLKRLRYVGVDVSTAVEVASARFAERGIPAGFIQVDLNAIPLAPQSVDLIFSEGVLHHTDSTEKALAALVPLLKKGGRIMFYVYKKKGPIREFTDDHVRQKLQGLPPEKAWELMMPLTKLGKVLGDLDLELDVPEDIELLQIPRGKINLQRFFYWHVFKAFYRPDHTLEELNHINFDWYAPMNAHRQTPEEVRAWCKALSLSIEREIIQEAGITVIAKRS
ncbi:MAG: class I SAM-dependent methyltransferase [Myxococcales bacterium]|nr:class I SAM-dependent methyltransferase [Myxococcales bacterium]